MGLWVPMPGAKPGAFACMLRAPPQQALGQEEKEQPRARRKGRVRLFIVCELTLYQQLHIILKHCEKVGAAHLEF